MSQMIPPRDELTYYLDEIMRDAKTQREVLTRLGLWYCADWQKVRRWLVILQIPLPFAHAKRSP